MTNEFRTTVHLAYGGETIPVAVSFGDRKRLSLSVHPDRSVTAIAPAGRSVDEVIAHLHRRRKWIIRQRRHFEQYLPAPEPRRYVSGETHLYLGRQYRLRVQKAERTEVKLSGGYFQVGTPAPDNPRKVATALNGWYRSRAERVFREQIERLLETAPSLRPRTLRFQIRTMKRAWGTCSPLGTISLNLELIKAPRHCIDYVIVHELCHLKIHNHSPAFYRLLSRHMPDWKERKARLAEVPGDQPIVRVP